MSDLNTIPLQDGFTTTLAQAWNGQTGTMYLNDAPSFTFPSGVTCYVCVDPGKSSMQIAEFDAYNAGAKTLNITNVTLEKGAGLDYTAVTHSAGAKVIISDNYAFWKAIRTAMNSKLDETGGTITGRLQFSGASAELSIPNLTTTQRDALSANNGDIIYNTTLGEYQNYNAGAWYTFAAGSTQPNASDTVAGKVEVATQAEFDAGTSTGGTGASLVATPDLIQKNIYTSTAKTTLVDADMIGIGDSADANKNKKITWANAKTQLNTDGVGQGTAVVSLTAGEDITIGDNLCYKNTSTSETQTQNLTGTNFGVGRVTPTGVVTNNIGQKLTLSSVGYIQRVSTVKFDLKKIGSPTDNAFVSIYNDDLVTVIDTSNVLDLSTLTTSYTTQTFTFSGNQNLIPGKTYYYVLRRSGAENDTNYYQVDGGAAATSVAITFNGTDWTTETSGLKSESSITTYTIDPTTVMKMDANDPLKIQDAGIATETKTTGQAVKVQMSGVVAGLSGLTPNLYYYASDTAGALSTTPSTTYNIRIGKAISATQLLIDKKKISYYVRNFVAADQKYNGASVDYNAAYSNKYIRVYTGFRPNKITLYGYTAGGVFHDSIGWSNGQTNRGKYSTPGGTTVMASLASTSFFIGVGRTGTVTGLTNFLDNGFEIYYTKADTTAFDGTGNLYFDVE